MFQDISSDTWSFPIWFSRPKPGQDLPSTSRPSSPKRSGLQASSPFQVLTYQSTNLKLSSSWSRVLPFKPSPSSWPSSRGYRPFYCPFPCRTDYDEPQHIIYRTSPPRVPCVPRPLLQWARHPSPAALCDGRGSASLDKEYVNTSIIHFFVAIFVFESKYLG